MAIRSEPFALAFDQLPALANTTRHDFAAKTLHIPMTQSRVFRSVTLRIHYLVAQAAAVTSRTIGIKLGAAAFQDLTQTNTLANGGECEWHSHDTDVTDYFNTNFGGGTSQVVQAAIRVTSGASGTSVISAEIFGVVEYEDTHVSANTRVRHVAMDINSPQGGLTTTLQTLGTFNFSALPEAGITVRQVWFEVEGQCAASSASTHALELAVNLEGGVSMGTMGTLASGNMPVIVWTRDDLDPLIAIDFRARCVDATGRWPQLSVRMHVTYTYDHAASTRLCAWTRWPMLLAGPGDIGTPGNLFIPGYFDIDIQDPGTIDVMGASITVYNQQRSQLNAIQTHIGVGAQTETTYTNAILTMRLAGNRVNHLFGPGAPAGDQTTALTRGRNRFSVSIGCNAPVTQGEFNLEVNGYASILTIHDKPPEGDGVCTKTFDTLMDFRWAGGSSVYEFSDVLPVGAQGVTGRYLAGAIGWVRGEHRDTQGTWNIAYSTVGALNAPIPGESLRDSPLFFTHAWRYIDTVTINCFVQAYKPINLSGIRRVAPDAQGTGIDLSVPRKWRQSCYTQGRTLYNAFGITVTSHGYRYSFGDRLLGFSGDGSGISVQVLRADNHELVAQTTSTVGGFFSADVFDDTTLYYAVAQQSPTRFGRTRNSPA